jgi:hypothetical protein
MQKHKSYTRESKLVEAESGEGDEGRGRQRAQQPGALPENTGISTDWQQTTRAGRYEMNTEEQMLH